MQKLFDTDCFLVPRGDAARFCRFAHGRIQQGDPVSLPFGGSAAVSGRGWLVALVRDGRRVWIGRWSEENLAVKHHHTLALPLRSQVSRPGLVLVGDVAFVGGVAERSTLFGWVDLAAESPVFTSLTQGLPPRLLRGSKPVDALVADDKMLCVVDNIVVPKFLVTYHVQNPRVTRFSRLVELPLHGTYEHYFHGVLGRRYLALLSSSVGRAGACHHVSLLDRFSLREHGALHLQRSDHCGGLAGPTYRGLAQALFWRDRLLLVDVQGDVASADPETLSGVPLFGALPELGGERLAELVVLPRSGALVAIGREGSAVAGSEALL